MNEFEIKVDMLISSLEKKREALSAILNITENQKLVLADRAEPAYGAMFNEMNAIKQESIDAVMELDRLFQSVFESISPGFEENATAIKDKVAYMQDLITEVLEMDIKIRAAEQRNKAVLDEGRIKPRSAPGKTAKSNLLKQYEKNKKPEKS